MDGVERKIKKERLADVPVTDQTAGLFRNEVRGVAFVMAELVIPVPVKLSVAHVREIVDVPEPQAILMVEAALGWQVGGLKFAQVPLAGNGRFIARLPKCLREGAFRQRQPPARVRSDDTVNAGVRHIAASHQRSARRRT